MYRGLLGRLGTGGSCELELKGVYVALDLSCDVLGSGRNIGFPCPNDMPAGTPERPLMSSVSCPVRRNLGNPVSRVCTPLKLSLEASPVPAVPEVSVAEDNEPYLGEDDIGLTWQVFHILPVSKTESPERPAKKQFCFRIEGSVCLLCPGAFGGGRREAFEAWGTHRIWPTGCHDHSDEILL